MAKDLFVTCCFMAAFALQSSAFAHDVPGKPSHVMSDDPNAPPSLQMESQVGQYHLTLIAFPAFLTPDETGTVNLYAMRVDDGQPFFGEVTFKVRNDSLFSSREETIGTQQIHGDHYSQDFVFEENGDYIIRAEFEADGESHAVDLPLTIGTPSSLGTIGVVIAALLIALIIVNLVQRQRLQRVKTMPQHANDQ